MRQVANRRIFYDFTFSPPKSVSIQALVANDPRIVEAHQRATRVAVQELENFAGTRVHHGKAIYERLTGNVIAPSTFSGALLYNAGCILSSLP